MLTPINDIILCDDHYISLVGTEHVLKDIWPKINVRKSTCGKEAIELFKAQQPAAVILDIGLNDISGIEVAKILRQLSKDCLIIILTSADDLHTLQQAQQSGAHAVLRKLDHIEHLQEALKHAQSGDKSVYLDPSVQALLQTQPGQSLSRREYEVLNLIISGHTSQEIATQLNCSITTVKTYRARIMNKSGTFNTAELMAWFLRGNQKRNQSTLP